MITALLSAVAAQAVAPAPQVEVRTVTIARPILSVPDVLAPALIPYVNCLTAARTHGEAAKQGKQTIPCQAERQKAAIESDRRLKKRMSERERQDLVTALILNLEALVANLKAAE